MEHSTIVLKKGNEKLSLTQIQFPFQINPSRLVILNSKVRNGGNRNFLPTIFLYSVISPSVYFSYKL